MARSNFLANFLEITTMSLFKNMFSALVLLSVSHAAQAGTTITETLQIDIKLGKADQQKFYDILPKTGRAGIVSDDEEFKTRKSNDFTRFYCKRHRQSLRSCLITVRPSSDSYLCATIFEINFSADDSARLLAGRKSFDFVSDDRQFMLSCKTDLCTMTIGRGLE
jgi:hypothetical protein